MKNPAFIEHCTATANLMKRLARIATLLDDECEKMTPVSLPSDEARQLLLEAFGNIEAIRHAHLPFIEASDPVVAFVMNLSLKNLIEKVSEITRLFSALEKRPKTLPKYLPTTMQSVPV